VGLAEDITPLRDLDTASQREGLLALRGGNPAPNWWLGVIQHSGLHATHPGYSPDWARLAAVALDTARETGDLADQEIVTRQANLSHLLSRHTRPEDVHPSLRPDSIVRESLALAETTPAEAGATEWAPRAEDVAVMRRLRRARNVIVPALQLTDQIDDPGLRRQLAAWRDVVPNLP
jgi:hypothetical protein